MENIKLHYFDTRGKGEFIRLLLHAAGQKFEDVIVPLSSWGPEGKAGETIFLLCCLDKLLYAIMNAKIKAYRIGA